MFEKLCFLSVYTSLAKGIQPYVMTFICNHIHSGSLYENELQMKNT